MTSASRQVLVDLPEAFHEHFDVRFTLYSDAYFAQNAIGRPGHFALVARADVALQAEAVRGHGLIFGNGNGYQPYPTIEIESWQNGFTPENYLLNGPGPLVQLLDGVPYDIQLFTRVTADRSIQTIRYVVSVNGSQIYDSGEVNDPNLQFDPRKSGVYVGHVFDNPSPAVPWSMSFTNVVTNIY